MRIRFSKMHGIGNDFIVIDAVNQSIQLRREQIQQLSDRHFGIGCDQVLLVESSYLNGVDFRYRIFNADGGEVEQCGNGARCFVRYVRLKGLTQKTEIQVETAAGVIALSEEAGGLVRVNMGQPDFEPHALPFIAEANALHYPLVLDGQMLDVAAVSMGNPHAVMTVDDVNSAPVAELGPLLESHPRFPKRVNAGFMQIIDTHNIRLRVYERGAGETLACGTGACAAVACGIRQGLLQSPVDVHMRGGMLKIAWAGEAEPVWMTGPAELVFDGEISIDEPSV